MNIEFLTDGFKNFIIITIKTTFVFIRCQQRIMIIKIKSIIDYSRLRVTRTARDREICSSYAEFELREGKIEGKRRFVPRDLFELYDISSYKVTSYTESTVFYLLFFSCGILLTEVQSCTFQ